MAITDNLVAYWSLEEASGSRADSKGSNTLTDNNTVTSATGKVGTAAQFTAANNEYLSVADNADVSCPGDLTIACWINPTVLGQATNRTLVEKDDHNTHREYNLRLSNDSQAAFEVLDSISGYSDALVSDIIPSNAWSFLIASYTNADKTPRLSLNSGTEVAGSAITNGPGDTTASLTIGGTGYPMDGLLDEVAVWRRILTSTERTWLYNSGNGRSYADLVAASVTTRQLAALGVG